MMRVFSLLGAAGLACILSSAQPASAADTPILTTTFEKDAGDWMAINLVEGKPLDNLHLDVVHAAAQVKEGKGSLEFKYNIKKGEANSLMLRLGVGTVSNANSFHFWIQPDHSTSFLFVVSVKGGARYQTTFSTKAKSWQEVSIALSDLAPSDDPGTPKDPAGKLQADQIESLGMIDTDCMMAQMVGDAPTFINMSPGAHTVLISPFSVNPLQLAPPLKSPAGERQLTTLMRPQVDWMVVGGMAVEKSQGAPLTGPGIKATYTQTKGKVFALLHNVVPGAMVGAKQIKITAGSKNPVTLMVQLEESDGGKYKSIIAIPGGSVSKDYFINIADLTAADDSKDANDKLDLDLVNKILVIDLSGTGDVAEGENMLWFNNLKIFL